MYPPYGCQLLQVCYCNNSCDRWKNPSACALFRTGPSLRHSLSAKPLAEDVRNRSALETKPNGVRPGPSLPDGHTETSHHEGMTGCQAVAVVGQLVLGESVPFAGGANRTRHRHLSADAGVGSPEVIRPRVGRPEFDRLRVSLRASRWKGGCGCLTPTTRLFQLVPRFATSCMESNPPPGERRACKCATCSGGAAGLSRQCGERQLSVSVRIATGTTAVGRVSLLVWRSHLARRRSRSTSFQVLIGNPTSWSNSGATPWVGHVCTSRRWRTLTSAFSRRFFGGLGRRWLNCSLTMERSDLQRGSTGFKRGHHARGDGGARSRSEKPPRTQDLRNAKRPRRRERDRNAYLIGSGVRLAKQPGNNLWATASPRSSADASTRENTRGNVRSRDTHPRAIRLLVERRDEYLVGLHPFRVVRRDDYPRPCEARQHARSGGHSSRKFFARRLWLLVPRCQPIGSRCQSRHKVGSVRRRVQWDSGSCHRHCLDDPMDEMIHDCLRRGRDDKARRRPRE